VTPTTDTGPDEEERRIVVRLYVAGDGPNSTSAIRTLQTLLHQPATGHVALEIIDVLKNPEQALQDGVLVTPMLVKLAPPPERRILGNLSDRAMLLAVLELERTDDA
jgi:circadian clock protein KaiB